MTLTEFPANRTWQEQAARIDSVAIRRALCAASREWPRGGEGPLERRLDWLEGRIARLVGGREIVYASGRLELGEGDVTEFIAAVFTADFVVSGSTDDADAAEPPTAEVDVIPWSDLKGVTLVTGAEGEATSFVIDLGVGRNRSFWITPDGPTALQAAAALLDLALMKMAR